MDQVSTSTEELPHLAGHWLAEAVTTAQSRVPVLGTFTTTTRAVVAIEIEQEGTDLKLRSKTHEMELESTTTLVRPALPDSFVRSMSVSTRPAKLVRAQMGWELVVPKYWEVQGARMDNPAEEKMPQKPSDPRVFDQNGDGNPGVTICVEGALSGELYVVQRGWYEWIGEVGKDEIAGQVLWGMEQKVIAASNRLMRRDLKTEPHTDVEKNQFRMHRVSAEHPAFQR